MRASVSLTIGDLARRTGTKVNTIRFYEEIRLMPPAARTAGGRRTYREDDFRRLSFIRHGRELGFSIEEVRSLIALSEQPDQDCKEAARLARRHLHGIGERIAQLEKMRMDLERVANSCDGGRVAQCGVIDAIADIGQETARRSA